MLSGRLVFRCESCLTAGVKVVGESPVVWQPAACWAQSIRDALVSRVCCFFHELAFCTTNDNTRGADRLYFCRFNLIYLFKGFDRLPLPDPSMAADSSWADR